jgi:hypothetical protein
MLKRKLLPCVLGIVFLSASCQPREEEALLRYTPQVGGTYGYRFRINRPHDPLEVTGEMHILGEHPDGYQVQFSGTLEDELFSRAVVISERHNSSDPGYVSLNFPDDPVAPGTEWRGEAPWYFEDYYVLDPTEMRLPVSYQLLEIAKGEYGRYAVIEQRGEADVAVDGLVLHVGQVGVRWDHEGRIAEVYPNYDAFGKLQVGDVVVGMNGQRAEAAGDLVWLAEKHIQRPKEAKVVRFTILRDGKEHDIPVEKSVDRLALVRVSNVRWNLKTTFDIDRGILLSTEATINQEDVAFTSPTAGTFPVVDDYDGFHKFGYLRERTTYQDHLGSDSVAWTLSLVEE